MAARLYENAERAGQQVTPGNIAYYAIQHARSGRRAYGQSSTDPLHPSTQLCGRARLEGFEEPVRTEEGSTDPLLLPEVFSVHGKNPSMEAARKLDWEQFTATLNERFRAIVEVIAQGGCLKRGRGEIQGHRLYDPEPQTATGGQAPRVLRCRDTQGDWRDPAVAHQPARSPGNAGLPR